MNPQLQLKNKILLHVDTYKYLGMRLDNSLSWKVHNIILEAIMHKILNW